MANYKPKPTGRPKTRGKGNHRNHRNKTSLQKREEEANANNRVYNNILTLQRQNDIIAMLLEGKESEEIKTYIVNKYHVQPISASSYLSEARKLIKERKNYEVDNLITLHLARYEKIYELLYGLKAFGSATKVLQAKEKIMGFHREGFHMKVSQGEITAIQLQQVNDEYDVMRLDEEKRNRMNVLLKKAKR